MEWRHSARIVAWVDMCFTLLDLLSLIVLMAMAGVVTEEARKNPDNPRIINPGILWGAAGVKALITFLQFWAVIQLIKATNPYRDAEEAYKMARNWRNVSIVFCILTLAGFVTLGVVNNGLFVAAGIFLIIRGTLFFIVHMFMKELQ